LVGSRPALAIWKLLKDKSPGLSADQFYGFDPIDKQGYETWPLFLGVAGCHTVLNFIGFRPDEGLAKVEVPVAFTMKVDETAKLCKYIAAAPHYLESWGDIQLTAKNFSLMQPTIKPLFATRQFQECLLQSELAD